MTTSRHDRAEDIFESWWRDLHPRPPNERPRIPGARAELARLRRLGIQSTPEGPRVDVAGAMTIESFRHLLRRFESRKDRPRDDLLVVAACCIARVKGHRGDASTAELLGGSEHAEERKLSESRFLRFLRVRSPEELMDQGRRLADFLNEGAPVGEFAWSLCRWLDAPTVRQRWAQDYYGLGQTTAGPTPSTSVQPQ